MNSEGLSAFVVGRAQPIQMIIKEMKTQTTEESGLGARKQDNQTVTGTVLGKSLRKKQC